MTVITESVTFAAVRESVAVARSHGEKFFEQIVWQVEHEAWRVLGYDDWEAMRIAEYGDLGVVAPRADRPELVARLRVRGLTQQQIAATIGVSQQTVSNTLRPLITNPGNEADTPAIVTNARGQQRPATYAPRVQPAPEPVDGLPPFDPTTGELLDDVDTADVIDPAPERTTGLDGKSYPKPTPAKPRRKPLTDSARDAGWELRKAVERLTRIAEDDRFRSNANEVATSLRGHLIYAAEVCQDLLDRLPSPEKEN